MKSTNRSSIHPRHLKNAQALQRANAAASASAASHPGAIHAAPPPEVSTIRTTGREYVNPVDYQHPFDSLARFAKALALRYDANRTRHAYYRQLRLLHEHFACDPGMDKAGPTPKRRSAPKHVGESITAARRGRIGGFDPAMLCR